MSSSIFFSSYPTTHTMCELVWVQEKKTSKDFLFSTPPPSASIVLIIPLPTKSKRIVQSCSRSRPRRDVSVAAEPKDKKKRGSRIPWVWVWKNFLLLKISFLFFFKKKRKIFFTAVLFAPKFIFSFWGNDDWLVTVGRTQNETARRKKKFKRNGKHSVTPTRASPFRTGNKKKVAAQTALTLLFWSLKKREKLETEESESLSGWSKKKLLQTYQIFQNVFRRLSFLFFCFGSNI